MNCKKCRNCVLLDQEGAVTCRAFLDNDDNVKTFSRPYACMFFEHKRKARKKDKTKLQQILKETNYEQSRRNIYSKL